MNTNVHVQRDRPLLAEKTDQGRRQLLLLLSAAAGINTLQVPAASAREDAAQILPPRRALTGRDTTGKSIFQSFDVTPQVVTFESARGSRSMKITLPTMYLVLRVENPTR
jgi:hypothetical protein